MDQETKAVFRLATAGETGVRTIRRAKELGADLCATDQDGNTLLHFVAKHGSTNSVVFLLDMGVDPCRRSLEGKTASEIAREHGHIVIATLLDVRVRIQNFHDVPACTYTRH